LHERGAGPDAGGQAGTPRAGLPAGVHRGDADDDEQAEEIVITNPAARERGEVRVGDGGCVTWEYFGRLDEAGVASIVDEVTNALRATSVRPVKDRRP
jgi:hypothetical protein